MLVKQEECSLYDIRDTFMPSEATKVIPDIQIIY
jgi:hypothetical protein